MRSALSALSSVVRGGSRASVERRGDSRVDLRVDSRGYEHVIVTGAAGAIGAATARAGLAMASEIARADLAARGIQVITVYPGPVKSALEAGARADYGGAGVFGKFAPTGDPDELAHCILRAITDDEPRVVYPRAYGLGWVAPNFSRWFALAYGPPPIA